MKSRAENPKNTPGPSENMSGLQLILKERARQYLESKGEKNPSESRIQEIVDDVFRDLLKDNPAV